MDECTLRGIGVDVDAFIRFVESELPTYPQCERWVRTHATNLNEASIYELNEILLNQNKPDNAAERSLLAAKQRFIGIDDPNIRNPVMLNDLDDWVSVHAQVTQGAIPLLRLSCLNAAFAELLKELFAETDASRVTIRVDLPRFGFDPSTPRAEVKRAGVRSMLATTLAGTAIANENGTNPETIAAIDHMARERRTVVQDDVSKPDSGLEPPTELMQSYGVRARMLTPVFLNGKLAAWISVHENGKPRHWTQREVEAIERSAERAKTMLESVLRTET